MALFRRARRPESDTSAPSVEPSTDTVGNPLVPRDAARHAAPDTGPTRAELRMIQFAAEGRVARTVSSPTVVFWRVDGAFATDTKASMLDWLLHEGYLELGERTRVTIPVSVTDRGREVLGD